MKLDTRPKRNQDEESGCLDSLDSRFSVQHFMVRLKCLALGTSLCHIPLDLASSTSGIQPTETRDVHGDLEYKIVHLCVIGNNVAVQQ